MIRTTKAARPAAKKASVRKSALVQKVKADLETKLKAKAKTGSPGIKKLAETVRPSASQPDPTRTKELAIPGTALAELRQWAVDRAVSTYPAVIGGDDVRPDIKEVVARADALVAFVVDGTVPE